MLPHQLKHPRLTSDWKDMLEEMRAENCRSQFAQAKSPQQIPSTATLYICFGGDQDSEPDNPAMQMGVRKRREVVNLLEDTSAELEPPAA